jgi:glycosyltransferase involved in cell wall biosynthesis
MTGEIDVCLACQLHQVNQREFAKIISKDKRFNLTVITDSRKYPEIPYINQHKIHHYNVVPKGWLSRLNIYDILKFKKLLGKIDPDLLLTMGVSNLLFLGTTSGFKPTVLLPQGGETSRAVSSSKAREAWPIYKRIIYRLQFRELLSHVSEVWGFSNTNKTLYQKCGLKSEKFNPFDWGGVDTKSFRPRQDQVRYVDDSNTLVFGSFRRVRGDGIVESYSRFISALGELADNGRNFHFVMGGIYDDSRTQKIIEKINNKISDNGLEDRVTRVGMINKEELPRYISGLDAYVNFTWRGHPLPAIGTGAKEAMACGCVPLVFDDPSVEYVIDDGHNGVILPYDVPTIVNKLGPLFDGNGLKKRISNSARETVVNEFDYQVISDRVYNACQNLISGNSR